MSQFWIIFNCYLNLLVFTGTWYFSYSICVHDRKILICCCIIYSLISIFDGIYADYYYAVARKNRNSQWNVCIKCKSNVLWSLTLLLHNISMISMTLLSIFPLLCENTVFHFYNEKIYSWINLSVCRYNINSSTAHISRKLIFWKFKTQ